MIHLSHVKKSFGALQVIEDLTFAIAPGEVIAILGPSGAGKTTLLRMLADLDRPDEGTIAGTHGRVAVVFQEDRLLPWITARENLELVVDKGREGLVEELLVETGLFDHAHLKPAELSGGMRQRLSLARAFCREPALLLMDEPFQSLDLGTKERMHALFLSLYDHYRPAVLLITHDVEEALTMADRILIASQRPLQIQREVGLSEHPKGLARMEEPSLFTLKETLRSLVKKGGDPQ